MGIRVAIYLQILEQEILYLTQEFIFTTLPRFGQLMDGLWLCRVLEVHIRAGNREWEYKG